MKKRTILFLCICVCPFLINAQTICGEVMYKEEARISLFFQTISITNFNSNEAYTEYLHYKDARPLLKEEYDINDLEGDIDVEVRENEEITYCYTTSKETYFTETLWDSITVKESPFSWDWELIDENKKIGKFYCKKATIQFRGRTFIAWYAPEIPAPFGPTKFKGLPGLILEVYDSEKKWYMKAIKIKLENTNNCKVTSKDFSLKETKGKAVSIKRYLQLVDSLHIDELKKQSSKMPKGQGIPIPNGCERYYNGFMVEIFKKR